MTTRRLGKARRLPRARGWRHAGMRSNRELTEARLAYVDALVRGRIPFYTVTRRWPHGA